MKINDLSGAAIERSIHIHKELGPGLLESVYERVLAHELRKMGLKVQTQVPIPILWDGIVIDESFRADIIVEGRLLLELKSVETTHPVHKKQTLTYTKLSKLKLGLLINFGEVLLKDGVFRLANNLPESE